MDINKEKKKGEEVPPITTRQEYIDQEIHVFGKKWGNILFKKWTFANLVNLDDCCVFKIIEVSPNIDQTKIYDTEEEATITLKKILEDRCKKVLEKTNYTEIQPYSNWHWIRSLKEV